MSESKTWCHDCYCWHDTELMCAEIELQREEARQRAERVNKMASATQVGGDHYSKLAIGPLEYSMRNKLDAMQHTVIKYVTRFRDKNGIEDLRKAIHTLELLIEHEEQAS